jgi:hypothetical protein
MPAAPVDRLDRRPEREAARVVEAPHSAPAPAQVRLWPWLLLVLLGLGMLALWYFTRPAVTTTSLAGTKWHWARTLLRDGSETATPPRVRTRSTAPTSPSGSSQARRSHVLAIRYRKCSCNSGSTVGRSSSRTASSS